VRANNIARDYRVNEAIRARQVLVIDETGTQLGTMTLAEALERARGSDLDLVEVAPQADPPVCRLLDYGKFRFMQTKKQRETRKGQKTGLMREVRFRPRIGDHDIDAKGRQVRKLLSEGSKVKVSVMFRGREITHPELGAVLLRKIAESLKEESKLEKAPSMEGRFLSIVLAPTVVKEAGARLESDEDESDDISEVAEA
jgi:translation initiation factor IF-3